MDYNKNYYQVLGIDKSCEEQEIKKAFRNLSKTHHPDKGGDANKFKELNEANSILSDTQKRTQYDNNSPHGRNYRPSNFGGFGGKTPYNEGNGNPFESYKTNFGFDINDFFNRSGFRRTEEFFEDLDIELTINISLEEIYNNKSREFTYIRNVSCTPCEGTGEVNMNGHVSCHHCAGTGRLYSKMNGQESICTNCGGSGKITKKVCDDCKGSKIKMKKETLPLSNLFILSESQRTIAYNGYGNYSKHIKGRVGKLILNLIPVGNDKYKKLGKDLYYKTKLDFKTAILGGKLEYEHLDGKIYSISIPEKTNTDARFKLKEKGLIITPQGNRGDLYIDVDIYINYDKLSDADISVIKSVQ